MWWADLLRFCIWHARTGAQVHCAVPRSSLFHPACIFTREAHNIRWARAGQDSRHDMACIARGDTSATIWGKIEVKDKRGTMECTHPTADDMVGGCCQLSGVRPERCCEVN